MTASGSGALTQPSINALAPAILQVSIGWVIEEAQGQRALITSGSYCMPDPIQHYESSRSAKD